MSCLSMFLFGSPRVEIEGTPLEFGTRKAVALLSYLAVTGECYSRDALVALLWPQYDQRHGRAALRSTIWAVKKTLGQEWLTTGQAGLSLKRGDDFWLDVQHFQDRLTACLRHSHPADEACPDCLAPLTEAVGLYRDDFMLGFTLADSANYDDWQLFQGQWLHRELGRALGKLVRIHSTRRELDLAIMYARRRLALDPLHEPTHRHLMQLHALSGQQTAALQQYQQCAHILRQELGTPPHPKTTQLYKAILAGQGQQVVDPPPIRTHNLPVQLTPFVGRAEELAEIGRLLEDPACRLLTLVGPGGVGKTRLAIQAAAQAAQSARIFSSIAFVPLDSRGSAELIVPSIAEALGLSLAGKADPRLQILDYLRSKKVLLVLDNFEHLLDGGTELVLEILRTALGVKLLITSREHLDLQGEWLFQIQGLRFPQDDASVLIEEYSALQLFVQSARRARPGFELSERDKPFLICLCRFMEGLPLGIEIAAAWTRALSCQEIAREFGRSLDTLTFTPKNVPERHRSLRVVFDHSWRLLSAEEKGVFRRLGVFRGGFEREAAEQVTGASLLTLLALMRKSFLRRGPAGRYELQEVLRQYAEGRLREEPAEEAATRARHSEYYGAFLQLREAPLRGPGQREALAEIGREMENVRAAWHWAVEQGQEQVLSQSLEPLYVFCLVRGRFREGQVLFARMVEMLRAGAGRPEGDHSLLAKTLACQGGLCQRIGLLDKSRELSWESLTILRRIGARSECAHPLFVLATTDLSQGDFVEAERQFREALDLYREQGDRSGEARSLNGLGLVARRLESYEKAEGFFRQCLELFQETGDRWGTASSLTNLGMMAGIRKSFDEAEQFFQQGLAIYQELDARREMSICLQNLGILAGYRGDYLQAKKHLQQGLVIDQEIGNRRGAEPKLGNLGSALYLLGEYQEAWKCFCEALQIDLDLEIVHGMLAMLVGMAMVLSKTGAEEQAVEIVAYVLAHPTTLKEARDEAAVLLAELASRLDPQVLAMAQERGRARDLDCFIRLYQDRPAPGVGGRNASTA